MPYGLSDQTFSSILSVIKSNPAIDSAILFGSRAKGTYKDGSDIDIALHGSSLRLNDILQLQRLIDESDLAYTFDLVIFKNIQEQALIEHIQRVGIEIYRKE